MTRRSTTKGALPTKTFKTTIYRDGPMCFIPVTFDPRAVFGKVRVPVKVTAAAPFRYANGPRRRQEPIGQPRHVQIEQDRGLVESGLSARIGAAHVLQRILGELLRRSHVTGSGTERTLLGTAMIERQAGDVVNRLRNSVIEERSGCFEVRLGFTKVARRGRDPLVPRHAVERPLTRIAP